MRNAIIECMTGLSLIAAIASCSDANSDASGDVSSVSKSNVSSNARITGRLSMGSRDPNQCGMGYSADEKVNGYWVAGVDGALFGSTRDGQKTSVCGKIISIRGIQFIIVDRIWENDGVGGRTYNNKGDADRKTNGVGAGYQQVDIAKAAFYQLGGNNFDATIDGVGSSGSSPPGTGAPPPPSGGDSGCSYADAAKNNGWGWNASTGQSCPPQASSSGGGGSSGGNTGCSYADAAKYNGWGWNASTGQSCPPLSGSSGSGGSNGSDSGCSYADAAKNNGWGWNASTGQSCPPR